LEFTTASKTSAAIHVSSVLAQGGIIGQAIKTWCEERQKDAIASLEQRPKEGKMDVDLSKPVRFKGSKKECWPSNVPVVKGRIALVYTNDDGDLCVASYPLTGIENIPPEPVKHTLFVVLDEDVNYQPCLQSSLVPWISERKAQKLTVWCDEDGKTHVEVAE
jgi:hypothetical protein